MIFRKSAKFISLPILYVRCNSTLLLYDRVVAVNMPSPAEVSANRKTCVKVWYSLSEGDRTGEQACEVWTSKQRLARSAVRLVAPSVTLTPEDRAKIKRYASEREGSIWVAIRDIISLGLEICQILNPPNAFYGKSPKFHTQQYFCSYTVWDCQLWSCFTHTSVFSNTVVK